jgi:hypothetical protein
MMRFNVDVNLELGDPVGEDRIVGVGSQIGDCWVLHPRMSFLGSFGLCSIVPFCVVTGFLVCCSAVKAWMIQMSTRLFFLGFEERSEWG